MANTSYATLAAVAGRNPEGTDVTDKIRSVKSKAGGRIPWRTVQRWVALGLVDKIGEAPAPIRYILTEKGVAQVKHTMNLKRIAQTQKSSRELLASIKASPAKPKRKRAPAKPAPPATAKPMHERPLPFSQGGPPGGW
jgi:hypothetical protein